jgi:arsenite methyltransferase
MNDHTDPRCLPGSCDTPAPPADDTRDKVREGYAEIARSGQWSGVRPASAKTAEADAACCGGGGCCGPTTLTPEQVATAVGYADSDLRDLPDGANLGLSCGNPTAIASLREGETLLDLGAGAGLDCFLAGPRLGPDGRAIGVDMTPDMLARARAGLETYRQRTGLDNVEFRLGEIERLPVPDASVDVVVSNCVINLSPDKPRVWREIARVLRPGGRVAISDLALLRTLPDAVRDDLEALVGCVAGACLVEDIRAMMRGAGLAAISLEPKPGYVEQMSTWSDPLYKKIAANLPEGTAPADFVTSLNITATKP